VLGRVRALAPEARVGLLVSRRYPQDAVARAQALGAEALHPEAVIVDAALVEAAHGAGLAVYVYTVDDPGEMRRLLALGVDGLFTNSPDRMRQIVDAPRG
jgi:glycerophosphoryl diester phosphodiesterase